MTIPSSDQMDHIKQRTAALGAALCDVRSRQSRTTMLAVTL
jgi:hypothetical protein